MDQNNEDVYKSLFNVESFNEIQADNIDETNENELNVRIVNLINQFRLDNNSVTQPYRTYFISEKSINSNNELKALLSEDQYKDEPYYVDYLANVHSLIQNKMS